MDSDSTYQMGLLAFIMSSESMSDLYKVGDIVGAKKAGGKGILIYTGKTKYPLPPGTKLKPDYEAMNLIEVIKLLEKFIED